MGLDRRSHGLRQVAPPDAQTPGRCRMKITNPFSRSDLASLPISFWLVGQEVSLVQRRGRYAPASMRHPGKMLPLLARNLVEEYTKPGDWILDPLSGIGTTGVEA